VALLCSGLTKEQPALLRYALHLKANVQLVAPARVELARNTIGDPLGAVLSGRPLLALAFDRMTMLVEKPTRC
jgi:hypothetical protein